MSEFISLKIEKLIENTKNRKFLKYLPKYRWNLELFQSSHCHTTICRTPCPRLLGVQRNLTQQLERVQTHLLLLVAHLGENGVHDLKAALGQHAKVQSWAGSAGEIICCLCFDDLQAPFHFPRRIVGPPGASAPQCARALPASLRSGSKGRAAAAG